MSQQELTEYEERRRADHIEICRATATSLCIRNRLCNLRECRRKRVCSGPMVASPHQAWTVRAQQEVGLSGKACADLPLCIAHKSRETFAIYMTVMGTYRKLWLDDPMTDLMPTAVMSVAMRRLSPKRS
ncbi:hypothetical protein [Neorhizobium sp. SOG26]|uniref:hypothetical protein n=1 Tax=Neorhizobium sp. SOG26 TaxID=2060726 RepID=UPI0012376DFF|nr:hypothetical protein [Neorhizobium sp. SOG26]